MVFTKLLPENTPAVRLYIYDNLYWTYTITLQIQCYNKKTNRNMALFPGLPLLKNPFLQNNRKK